MVLFASRSSLDLLPPESRDKLRDLAAALDDARASVEAARLPLKKIDRTRDGLRIKAARDKLTDAEAEELARLDAEHAKVMTVVNERAAAHRDAAALLSSVNQWLVAHTGSHLGLSPTVLVPFSTPVRASSGRTIAGIRDDIARTKAEIARVRRASLPTADLRAEIAAHVASLVNQGRPRMTGVNSRDRFSISWERGVHPAAVAAWLDPDKLVARMVADLPATDPDAMSPRMKSVETARLTDLLLDLERQEEAVIESSPVPVARRPDADPAAILGVEARRRTAPA